MAFTVKALAFLDENYVRNDREWFKEHKQQYNELVIKPFCELLEKLAPLMEKTDSELVCTPKCISRIYRDARYVKGGAIFRDSVWCSIRHKRSAYELIPEFYFYLSVNGYGYGCGYYKTTTAAMEQLRKMAFEGDKVFTAARRAFEKQDSFYLAGEMYKKDHFPQADKKLWDWVNRKSICLCRDCTDAKLLFSDELFETVERDFESIVPVYRLFNEMEKRAAQKD